MQAEAEAEWCTTIGGGQRVGGLAGYSLTGPPRILVQSMRQMPLKVRRSVPGTLARPVSAAKRKFSAAGCQLRCS